MELVKIITFIDSLKPFSNKWTNSIAMHFSFYYDDVKCLLFSILEELRIGNVLKYSKNQEKMLAETAKQDTSMHAAVFLPIFVG